MGHIHFDDIGKFKKKKDGREMPEITKPRKTMCKHHQHGKQTKVEFKTKEYCMKKPLEIVHTYICGATRKK
jgi:hypothetical protein